MFALPRLPTSVAADARTALILLIVAFTALTILRWNNAVGYGRDNREGKDEHIAAPTREGVKQEVHALAKSSSSFLDYLRSLDDRGLTEFTKRETSYREPEFWLSQRDAQTDRH